jgi:non-specific serine/threonine protein kinase
MEAVELSRSLGDKRALVIALESVAGGAGNHRRPEKATRLFGAAAALRTAISVPVSPVEETEHQQKVDQARRQLGQEGFSTAWEAGHALSPEAALDEALAFLRVPVPFEKSPDLSVPFDLTAREREVLQLLVQGRTNPEIAALLYISPKTATNHVSSILAKLGVETRTAAASLAVRNGLV